MERWEGRRVDADDNGQDEEAPAAGGDGPNDPLTGGGPIARPHRGPGRSAQGGGHGGRRG